MSCQGGIHVSKVDCNWSGPKAADVATRRFLLTLRGILGFVSGVDVMDCHGVLALPQCAQACCTPCH